MENFSYIPVDESRPIEGDSWRDDAGGYVDRWGDKI